MSGARSVTRKAPAKINLALAVSAPTTPGGLHPIASWMVAVDLFDEVRIERTGENAQTGETPVPQERTKATGETPVPPEKREFHRSETCAARETDESLTIHWADDALRVCEIDWPAHDDLCARAHRLLEREVGAALPAHITLTKRIPVGAGLAGGSSDAAATLLALRELFALDLSDARLRYLSRELGSDIAFFLPPGACEPAIVEGMGDRIERTPGVSARLLLIAPDFGCPTPMVYRAFDDEPSAMFRDAEVRTMARAGELDPAALFNDLTAPARRAQPALRRVQEAVESITKLRAHITGSGSGVFVAIGGLPDDKARQIAQRLRSEDNRCAARLVTIVSEPDAVE